jgi:hypothetical protein
MSVCLFRLCIFVLQERGGVEMKTVSVLWLFMCALIFMVNVPEQTTVMK